MVFRCVLIINKTALKLKHFEVTIITNNLKTEFYHNLQAITNKIQQLFIFVNNNTHYITLVSIITKIF